MLTVFTKEQILQAKNDPVVLENLVETTRFMLIGMYLQSATQADDSEEEIDALNCPRCGELTLYSQQVLMPSVKSGVMCLSKKCIQDAVLGLSHTYESQEPGNDNPAPPMSE